jgi:2-polyprenyl-6-methoxyphenol hydroxylase-like FAD-dependent oxidoreductase
MTTASRPDTDVLVVGAGPTGLMLANQLLRGGARVEIIDRHDGPARETRALGVQARTLEIYAHLGIVEEALALGKRATGANMWAAGKRAARIPFGDIGQGLSPYPFLLILGQDDNERLLGAKLRELGASVRWRTELVALSQEEDRVRATLAAPDGTRREIAAAWLAGCDGARSTVREQCGIAFEGAAYEHVFFVADTQMTGPMTPDELNVYLWRAGFHLFFPMRGTDHWRVVGILPAELRGREDLTFDDVIPSIRGEAGSGLSFQGCEWFSTYRIHHRRAARFRDRRCFLLGDAAHIHSPVGAQGMNTGLQDAYNLAWKLALVLAGTADPALLASYEAERIPIADSLLRSTDRGFSAVVSDSWAAGVFRTRILAKIAAAAMGVIQIRKAAFRTISQIGIHYQDSPLSETQPGLFDDSPRGGDRFPPLSYESAEGGPRRDLYGELDDTRFSVVAVGQKGPAGPLAVLGDCLRSIEIPNLPSNTKALEQARVPPRSFYLLRPDGYVALCGVDVEAEAIERYLVERMRIRI